MQWGGTVLIDRENAKSAREAMEPLVDVMRKEGRSVCIAPEGTRSTSTNLGRFKKGAFHLALQAQVPIVPIVIHNALDVAPRGQYVLKPATVKITVLPAVDTSDWTVETIDEHVHQVRDLFLEELDQMQFQPQREAAIKEAEQASRLRRKKLKEKLKKSTSKKANKPKLKVVASQEQAKGSERTVSEVAFTPSAKKPKRRTRRKRKTTKVKVSAKTLEE